jgi:hypothetical protein
MPSQQPAPDTKQWLEVQYVHPAKCASRKMLSAVNKRKQAARILVQHPRINVGNGRQPHQVVDIQILKRRKKRSFKVHNAIFRMASRKGLG